MGTEKGERVRIRFRCRLEDGRVCNVGDQDTLEFVIGAGTVPAALERCVREMNVGERRSIRVPVSEVHRFPFAKGSHFIPGRKTPPGIAYEFGPGEGGDVSQSIPLGESRTLREPIPAGTDLLFEVEMLAVDPAGS